MNIEYEVKILNINKKEVLKKLEELQAIFKWESVQKRYVYDFYPKIAGKWIRLRTNGKISTLTIKNKTSDKIDGMQEIEIEVSDFDKTHLILKELGYSPRSFQENKRIQYNLNGLEIDIDTWPLIPDYMEIEGKSEEEVMKVVELLGYTKLNVTSKDVESIYAEYGINLEKIENLELESDRK